MAIAEPITTTTISVFTRHSEQCPRADEPQWKRCNCRKSLYIREGGKTTHASAKTRSWDQAERLAQSERDRRGPVKAKLQKSAEAEAVKAEAEAKADAEKAEKLVPLKDALR